MRVVILGCGYLGLELGKQLESCGNRVVGVRRSDTGLDAIESAGFEAIKADVTDQDSLDSIPDADWVVFAASAPGASTAARKTYVDGLETAIRAFAGRSNPPSRFVYTSSTGVYGDRDGDWVDESTPLSPTTDRERTLVDAERVALEETNSGVLDRTVVRLAGMYGPGRYGLDRYLTGPVTEGYRNAVHRDDAAGATSFLLNEDLARNDVVLVVDDEPIQKPVFAAWLATECGVPKPPLRSQGDVRADESLSESQRQRLLSDKRCSNRKLRHLGYEFEYPTVRDGYQRAIEACRDTHSDSRD